MTWTKLHDDDGLEARYQQELAAARKKALTLGLDGWLYPFQFEDVVRASLKQSLLLTYQMGLGKTLEEARKITPAVVAKELGGLPKNKYQCSNLGAQALNRAIDDYVKKQGKPARPGRRGKGAQE